MKWLALALASLGATLIIWGMQTVYSNRAKAPIGSNEIAYQKAHSQPDLDFQLGHFHRSQSEELPVSGDLTPTQVVRKKYKEMQACLMQEEAPCEGYYWGGTQRDYYVDVLTRMHNYLLGEYEKMKADKSLLSPEREAFAQKLLSDGHEDIQHVGLKMIALFSPSEDNLKEIIGMLTMTIEPQLLEPGIELLTYYRTLPDFQKKFSVMVSSQIRYGTEATSKAATASLMRFLNQDSYLHFDDQRKWLEKLADDQSEHNAAIRSRLKNLDSVLSEYERLHQIQK